MKNITLAIDDDVLDEVRMVAARKRTTVNAMVREFLTDVASENERREKRARRSVELVAIRRAECGTDFTSTERDPMIDRVFLDTNVLIYAATGDGRPPAKIRDRHESHRHAKFRLSAQVFRNSFDVVQIREN